MNTTTKYLRWPSIAMFVSTSIIAFSTAFLWGTRPVSESAGYLLLSLAIAGAGFLSVALHIAERRAGELQDRIDFLLTIARSADAAGQGAVDTVSIHSCLKEMP